MGEMRNAQRVVVGKPEGNLCADGRIILKWLLKKLGAKMRTGFKWLDNSII
jgi:hypothetical protein